MSDAHGLYRREVPDVPIDGRQSETALMVARGTRRLLRAMGCSTVVELTLANGRRADIVSVGRDGAIHIVEIKSSPADFRADHKWEDYLDYCDRFSFAIPATLDETIIPSRTGLIVADAYGASMVRNPLTQKLDPARRRATLLLFARCAADRLHAIGDPACSEPG